jgi:Putative Ig domain
MIRAYRFISTGVSARVLGTALLIAMLFVAGCNTTSAPAVNITGATSQVDQGKTVTLTAAVSNDVNAGGVSWAITSGPGTLTGQSATGVTYNAPATVTSVTTVVVTATSVADHTKTANFTITLQPTPQITTTTMPSGSVGTGYSHTVTMTGGVSPFTWTLIAGPAGLSLSNSTTSTVTVQGTPTTAGVNQALTVKVTDAQGMSATSSGLTITVYPALNITAPSLPTGVVGVTFTSLAFTASGGSGSGYTFAVASGSLAPLTIGASTGIITGTPTTAGTLQFAVKVTDSVGNVTTSSTLSITINAAITVGLSPASPVTLDQGKTQLVTATVGNDPNSAGVTWSVVTGVGTLTGSTSTATTYVAPGSVVAASTATFTATSATDPTKSATYTIHLVPPPQITTSTMAAGNVNAAYTAPVAMTGGVAPYTWSFTALPAGLSLSSSTSNTVNVTGTPTGAGANQTVTVKVTDAQGLFATSSGLTITVYPTLVLTPPSLPVGVVGVSYASPAFTASGGSGSGYTFAVASGSLAPLTIGASSGIITGTPTTAGTLQFTVKVTDSVNNTVTSSNLSITVNPAITVSLSPVSPVTLDQGKTQPVTATVNNDPNSAGVTWSIVTGLGSLSGSSSTATTYNAPVSVVAASTATFTATSATDPTKSATYTIHLVPPPQITTSTMAAGNVNGAYTAPVTMTGGVAPYTWSFTALPAGLSLSSSTSNTVNVAGTPNTAGANQTVTVKVTDAQGLFATSSGLTITVYPTLVITPPSLPVGVVGVSYTSPAFGASGGSGSGYTFAVASGSLAPLTIGAGTGIITGTPTTAGTLQFTVKVTDSVGNTVTSSNLSITINPPITVGLSPASPITLDQGKTQLVNATVNNDPNSAGVTWSAVTGLGSLSGSTSTSTTYNAPGSVGLASSATFTATSVTDPSKSATYTVNLVPPPQITTTVMAAGNLNGAYSSPVSMTGGAAPYAWVIMATPPGLTLNGSTTSTVTVQGSPTVSGNGQTFTIKVTDAQGLSVTSSGLTIDVYATLVLTPPSLPLPTGVQGLNYPSGVNFTASGGSATGFTWSLVTPNSLPPGLALSAASGTTTSITTGTPTTPGTYPFSVKLTDSVGNTATTSGLSITINPPISISLSPAQPFAMDQNTTQLITATVNNDPSSAGVTWSALTGAGSLSGSTSTTITYNAPVTIASTSISTFTATSITDPSKSATFSVSLEPPPAFVTSSFANGTTGVSYSAPVTMNGGVGPYTWSFTALPPGLSLSSSTSNTVNVTGTPTLAAASQTVTIKVTDSKGLSNTLNSTMTVNAPSCSSNCTVTGTITGPWVSNIPVSISGSSTTTTTNSSGVYSFTGLASGPYTVTPTLAGYTFTPATPVVSGNTTTQDLTEASAVTSFSISGTVTYTGTHTTGTTFIRVYQGSSCSGCSPVAETSFPGVPSSSGTPYIVRGVQANGGYVVTAEIDTLGAGQQNLSDPTGSTSGVAVGPANGVANISVSDPSPVSAVPPCGGSLAVAPQSGFAVAQCKVPKDPNGIEKDTSYKIYAATDSAFTTNLVTRTFPAHGTNDNVFISGALTNGFAYYFKMTGFVGNVESTTSSNVVGPLTIGPSTLSGAGTGTVSGSVTFPPATIPAGTPLYVGVYSNSGIYAEKILNPTSGVTYSIPGVPNGTYQNFAIIDMNNNGIIDTGDITNAGGGNNTNPPTLVVSGNTTGTIGLSYPITTINVTTNFQRFAPIFSQPDSYSISLSVNWGSKRPTAITLFSAPNVSVPYDMSVDQNNGGQGPAFNSSAAPQVGDVYHFQVTYSDGTSNPDMQVLIGTVLGPSQLPQFLQMNSPVNSTNGTPATVPMLNWSGPATAPTSLPYTYSVNLYGGTNVSWYYSGGNNSNGIPSSTTNVMYNVDGQASVSPLPGATTYNWSVRVQDANGNSAQYTTTYTTP